MISDSWDLKFINYKLKMFLVVRSLSRGLINGMIKLTHSLHALKYRVANIIITCQMLLM